MKKYFALLGLSLVALSCNESKKVVAPAQPEGPVIIDVTALESNDVDVRKYTNTITEGELKEMLYVYASDEFEGRNTGDPGQKRQQHTL